MRRPLRHVLAAVVLSGCALHRLPTAPPSHPNEHHVLAETQRFAERLGVRVGGVITTKPHMVPASVPLFEGEKVPASGRWSNCGRIEYYRPIIRERTQEWASWLAAHEIAHVFYGDRRSTTAVEDRADFCAMRLMSGERCER